VVLYEMLTGRRAFEGPEISDVLASVLKDTPPLDALPADTPPSVRRLLRRALEKDPSRRLDSMSVARLELDDVQDVAVVMREAPASPRRMFIPVAIAAILSGLAVGAAMRFTGEAPPAPAIVRLSMTPTPDQPIGLEANHTDIAISPDGSRFVYLSENTQGRWFTMRSIDRAEGLVLNKLGEHPRGAFISHDGRWIGYQAGDPAGRGNALRKVPIDGGPAVTISAIGQNMRGGSWAADDTIVFATINAQTGLLRVPAAGGTPDVLTTPAGADGEVDHLWPQHLPDGRHVLFAISRLDGTWDVALLSLETKTWRVLVKDALSPRYMPSGHLLYATGSAVRAVAFDSADARDQGHADRSDPRRGDEGVGRRRLRRVGQRHARVPARRPREQQPGAGLARTGRQGHAAPASAGAELSDVARVARGPAGARSGQPAAGGAGLVVADRSGA
jgi:hypothetical protein